MKDERYTNGEYSAYFPSFYPDGDYYFFIEENFEFGYLGHPWRQEIWIFGRDLIKEIEQVYLELGWKKLNVELNPDFVPACVVLGLKAKFTFLVGVIIYF